MHDPHAGLDVLRAGPPLDEAAAAAVLVHGRGGSAREMIGLARELGRPDVSYLAPQARDATWYPYSFLVSLERNEPWLSSALRALGDVVGAAGMPSERLLLLGFSQGACLMLEFAVRNPARYGGLVGWSGGLIGPPGTPRDYPGSLEGVPVFLGCSDVDPHIPLERVEETAAVLEGMRAEVTTRVYPGMGHTVNADELDAARVMLSAL